MDKKIKILIGILVALLIVGPIVYTYLRNTEIEKKYSYVITNDSLNFEQEYEKLNETVSPSNDKEYLKVELPSYAPIKYTTYEEIFSILENGTGVIYFGFPECPWCRNLTPVLANSAIDYGIETIYYFNQYKDRDTLSLNKKGKVVTEKKGTEDYKKLVELLKDYLPEYRGLNDKTIKRLYFPTVLFVKDGKVLGLEQSLLSYTERVDGDPLIPMTQDEKTELANIFTDYYKQINPKTKLKATKS